MGKTWRVGRAGCVFAVVLGGGFACGRVGFGEVPAPGDAGGDGGTSCVVGEAPQLDLTFAGTLDARITFRRSSTASYVDGAGLIQFAAVDQPRFEHDPLSGGTLGLLLEEARTNQVNGDRSEELSADDGATFQSNVAVAPDGAMTADKLIESPAAMGVKAHYDAIGATANTNGTTYTWSVFARAAERREIALLGGAESAAAYFDLVAGTASLDPASPPGTRASIQAFPGGWYRCAVTYVRTGGSINTFQFIMLASGGTIDYQGDGVSGAYIWGTQVEEGRNLTSYIRTGGTPVTREADLAVAGLGTLFGGMPAGTLASEVVLSGLRGGYQTHYELSDGMLDTSAIAAVSDGDSTATNYVGTVPALTTATASLPVAGQVQRNAFRVAPGAYAVSVNGGPATALPASAPDPASQLKLGHAIAPGQHLDGVMTRIRYYAAPLSDADLRCAAR